MWDIWYSAAFVDRQLQIFSEDSYEYAVHQVYTLFGYASEDIHIILKMSFDFLWVYAYTL